MQKATADTTARSTLRSKLRPNQRARILYLFMLAAMILGVVLPLFPMQSVYAAPERSPLLVPADSDTAPVLPFTSQPTEVEIAPAAPDDAPIPVVTEDFFTFVVNSGLLYWEMHCSDPVELAAATDGAEAEGQAAPVLPAEVEGGPSYFVKRQPVNGGLRTTLATAGPYRDCRTFEKMYADADGVYFVDREVNTTPTIVHLHSGGGTSNTVFVAGATTSPIGERLVTDSTWVYWRTTDRVLRARKDGTTATPEVMADGLTYDAYADILVVGTTLWIANGNGTGAGKGLFRIPTTGEDSCPVTGTPCNEVSVSPYGGTDLASHLYRGVSIANRANQIYWNAGETLRVYSCPLIPVVIGTGCSDTVAVQPPDVPDADQTWYLGRPAFHGNLIFWSAARSPASGPTESSLRRKTIGVAGNGESIAELSMNSGGAPVFVAGDFVFYADRTGSTRVINKLSVLAAPIVRDLTADGIEVTQGIQNLANSAPLSARKTTYVRAFGSNLVGPAANAVSARLYGTRGGTPLPGVFLTPLNGTRKLEVGVDWDRARVNDGWLFQLPSSWVSTAGGVEFRLVVDPAHIYSDNFPTNNEISDNVVFQNQPPACVVHVPVRTHNPIPTTSSPNFWDMVGRYERMVPMPRVLNFTTSWQVEETEVCWWGPFPHPCGGPLELNEDLSISDWIPDRDEAIAQLFLYDLVHYAPACDDAGGYTHYMGMVHPSANTGNTAGYASTISAQSWVKLPPASPNPFPNTWDAMDEAGTMAQELAHNFGRKHVNCPTGTPDTDGGYPYPTCQIADSGQSSYYGFDAKTRTPIGPTQARDYMSYSSPVWTSDYTWRAIMNAVVAAEVQPAAADMSLIVSADGTVLANGFIDTDSVLGQLNFIKVLPDGSLSAAMAGKLLDVAVPAWNPDSVSSASADHGGEVHAENFHLRLLDADGDQILDQALTLIEIDDHDAERSAHLFAASFPAPAEQVATIQLMADDTILDTRSPGTSAPVVSIAQPAGGAMVTDAMTVRWNATDADGEPLVFTLQYSYDNGAHWQALTGDLYSTPDPVNQMVFTDLSALHGSAPNQALVRVIASDGYNTTVVNSSPFTLANRKPVAYITAPGVNVTLDAEDVVMLQGGATDAEDGALEGASLKWFLNNVQVGTGTDIAVTGLAPGDYTARLDATDGDANTGTYSLSFHVAPLSVPLATAFTLDGFCDDAGYGAGTQVMLKPYGDATQGNVHFVRSANYLWACFTNLLKGSETPSAFAGLRFDVNNSREALAQATDYGFFVGEDGGVFTYAGDGAGGFDAAGPGGLQAQISADPGGLTWSAELRIEKAMLGDWEHVVGMKAGHYWVGAQGDDYGWPYAAAAASWNAPNTWARTVLGLQPVINGVSPYTGTVGSLALVLTIEGENFDADATVLWNGVAVPVVASNAVAAQVDSNEDGVMDAAEAAESLALSAASVITVEVSAAQLATAGNATVAVRNGGPIDSTAAGFIINNPTPVITSLAPNGAEAEAPAFALVVNGSNFVNGAVVYWDGIALATTYNAANRLTAQVPATLLAQGKGIGVTVRNPAPVAEDSNGVTFTIAQQGGVRTWLPLVNR